MAAPKLLRLLDLTGVMMVGDAMQAQQALSVQVAEAGSDDVWFVKDNQKVLLVDLALLFERPRRATGWSDPATDFSTATSVNKGHGR